MWYVNIAIEDLGKPPELQERKNVCATNSGYSRVGQDSRNWWISDVLESWRNSHWISGCCHATNSDYWSAKEVNRKDKGGLKLPCLKWVLVKSSKTHHLEPGPLKFKGKIGSPTHLKLVVWKAISNWEINSENLEWLKHEKKLWRVVLVSNKVQLPLFVHIFKAFFFSFCEAFKTFSIHHFYLSFSVKKGKVEKIVEAEMIRIATTKVVQRIKQSWQCLAHQFNLDLEKKTKKCSLSSCRTI